MTFPNGVKCKMTDHYGADVGKPDGFYEFTWMDENNQEKSMAICTHEEEEDDNDNNAKEYEEIQTKKIENKTFFNSYSLHKTRTE